MKIWPLPVFAVFLLVLAQAAYAVQGHYVVVNDAAKQCQMVSFSGEICMTCDKLSLPEGWRLIGTYGEASCPEGYTVFEGANATIKSNCHIDCSPEACRDLHGESCPPEESPMLVAIALIIMCVLAAAFYFGKKRKGRRNK